jgi:hypothetical protein
MDSVLMHTDEKGCLLCTTACPLAQSKPDTELTRAPKGRHKPSCHLAFVPPSQGSLLSIILTSVSLPRLLSVGPSGLIFPRIGFCDKN